MLKQGEKSIEARMVGPVRKNNDHECEADFEIGLPTKVYPPPQVNGAAVTSARVNTLTTLPPDIVIGHSDGHAPDLTSVFDSGSAANLQPG